MKLIRVSDLEKWYSETWGQPVWSAEIAAIELKAIPTIDPAEIVEKLMETDHREVMGKCSYCSGVRDFLTALEGK
jgi:hypothetical protein